MIEKVLFWEFKCSERRQEKKIGYPQGAVCAIIRRTSPHIIAEQGRGQEPEHALWIRVTRHQWCDQEVNHLQQGVYCGSGLFKTRASVLDPFDLILSLKVSPPTRRREYKMQVITVGGQKPMITV